MKRRGYPSDVSDEEWALVAPYVTLMTETAPQHRYAVREVFNGLLAVDTLGHLLALHVTPANEQDRARVKVLATQVQAATGETVQVAFGDQGYTDQQPAQDAAQVGITLTVVKLPAAKQGFVLLPRRWVVERSFGWLARFRRLARDYERLPTTLAGLHFLTFAILMLKRLVPLLLQST